MATTIKDIAKALGISVSTVSRALNDSPQINDETIKAVKAVAKKFNYRRNNVAAGLRINKTFCLGVVVPNIGIYFYSRVISGMQKAASEAGYQLLICQTDEEEANEIKYLESLSNGRVDGILMAISKGTNKLNHVKQVMEEMPVVLFDRTDSSIDTTQVEADDFNGAFLATKHLIDGGARNIAHLAGPKNMQNSKNRLNGYKEALRQNDISVKQNLIENCDFDRHNVEGALKKILKSNPDLDGVFAVNDDLGVQAILVLKKMGYKIPEQISVIGFGNYPVSKIVEPRLTTVSHHLFEIGEKSVEYLLKMIKNKDAKISHEPLVSELILRESTKH
ncbi:LacI family DNA-binding transcriptional regulator [Fulvivirga lutea]|uniref:LacI family DNA-binding transcriptional regulator n=1 Tax=Fulvivirga lutea TaxID=2810512 RepID=A0A974WID5_9BACT|nr:LacI family DNA-binding transcriptional regulator [Fulvivirga lutea]QSE99103.1 LacI family DNA-binding transcriptional regulator [Fulvivirga lutea]